jgi:UDPglucose 6-dehydrogenase
MAQALSKASVVGLGKLGLPFTVALASSGTDVIAIDINKKNIEMLQRGKSPIVETDLQKFITKNKSRLSFTTEHKRAIEETDVTFIVVATPSDKKGNFSNKYVESALTSLSKELAKSKKKNHIFVINSTLMPSSTEKRMIPLIEKHSKRKLNKGFQVCYIPDFVALGAVINDFLNPDVVIIGESNKSAGNKLEKIYREMVQNQAPVHRMSIISAEIAKVSLNMYITMKISFANMLANISSRLKGADVDAITSSIGADKRISPYYFRGGLSFGGTCFPRDTKAFSVFAKSIGYSDDIVKAVNQINDSQDKYLANLVLKGLKQAKKKKISILGLSFKPGTPEIEKSPSITLINTLIKKGIDVVVYDKFAIENTKKVFGNKIKYANSPKECMDKSNVWVITTGEKEFKSISGKNSKHKNVTIIDCWRILEPARLGKNVHHLALGHNEIS